MWRLFLPGKLQTAYVEVQPWWYPKKAPKYFPNLPY